MKKHPYETINPSGSLSHFATLEKAVEKARRNAQAEHAAQEVWRDNRAGRLLVHTDGRLEVMEAHMHQADWDNDLKRSGLTD